MLTAAVAGEIFTSPSTDAVLDAIRAVAGPAGVLLIVKNYTGDRFNFGLAAEIARSEGIEVEMAVGGRRRRRPERQRFTCRPTRAGRNRSGAQDRGCCRRRWAPARPGCRCSRTAADALGTMGVALGSCVVPAAGRPGFDLAEDEIEWVFGIHGEPGVRRTRIQPADAIVHDCLTASWRT